MRVCMFLLSICLFTTLSIKRRSKLYPVGNIGLEQTEIVEAGADDTINAKKQLVLVTHKRTLYDTDDDSVVSSKKRFLTTGIPAALLTLSLHKFCAAYLERQLVCCIKCQRSRLFNKGSPDRMRTISSFSFYLKNYLRLFPFLLFSPYTRFSFPAGKQPSLQNMVRHWPHCTILLSNPLPSFIRQEYGLSCHSQEIALALNQSFSLNIGYFLLYGIRSLLTGYHPP